MDAKIEQYKILWQTLNDEMGRFWTRYNVLVGIQIAIIFPVVKFFIEGNSDPIVLIIAYFLLTVLSLFSSGIVWRAIKIYQVQVKYIEEYEKDNTDFQLVTNLSQKFPNETFNIFSPQAYYFALMITLLLFVGWFSMLTYELSILFY